MRRESLILVTLIVLMVTVVLLAPIPLPRQTAAERQVSLDARAFAFEPARIEVNRGDTIRLSLNSEDVVHGVYIDGYGVNLVAEPGKPAETTFVADRPGKYRLRCSVTCGSLHPFMIGELVVGPNLPFWRALAALGVVAGGTIMVLAVRSRDQSRRTGPAKPPSA